MCAQGPSLMLWHWQKPHWRTTVSFTASLTVTVAAAPPTHTHTSTTSSLSRKMSYDVKRTAVTHLSTSSALTLLYRTHLCHWPLGQPQQGPRMNPYATRADRKCRRGASQKAIKSQGEWKVFFFSIKTRSHPQRGFKILNTCINFPLWSLSTSYRHVSKNHEVRFHTSLHG